MEYVDKKRLSLTDLQKKERLIFAKRMKDMNFSSAIFTGEYRIGGIDVWGSISEDGPCAIRIFKFPMTSAEYVAILDEVLLPMRNGDDNLVFFQDIDQVTKSDTTRAWFASHPEVKFLDWPSMSDDMNPIKDVWNAICRRLEIDFPLGDASLIHSCWGDLKDDPQFIEDLYRGVTRCTQQVIDNCGGFII